MLPSQEYKKCVKILRKLEKKSKGLPPNGQTIARYAKKYDHTLRRMEQLRPHIVGLARA